MEQNQLKSAVEAILFALGEPVAQDRLAEALNVFSHQIEEACLALAREYEEREAGIRLIRLEEDWQLVSAPDGGTPSGRSCPGASRTSSPRRRWRPWPWWPISSR